jgi:hypothetical protein
VTAKRPLGVTRKQWELMQERQRKGALEDWSRKTATASQIASALADLGPDEADVRMIAERAATVFDFTDEEREQFIAAAASAP